MKSLYTILLTVMCVNISFAQIKLGTDINGTLDDTGTAVSISSDGNRMAVGAPGDAFVAGHVRVYEWNGTSWAQLGADINGETSGDEFGTSVSLSSNGSRIAIGGPENDGGGSARGHARVYEWNGTSWVQMGSDIDGEGTGDNSGSSVSISADGSRVAIGATDNDGGGSNRGHVRVYEWNGTSWVQLGDDINGEDAGDESGTSVSMSADGTRVAIGAPNNSDAGGLSGHVRIYEWNGTNWLQIGSDINGQNTFDDSGTSVSMSADGNRVAIGSPGADGDGILRGTTRVYEWDGSEWDQLGDDIDGQANVDASGTAVAMSGDGSRVAIGSADSDGGDAFGFNRGQVNLYEWDGSDWVQFGTSMNGGDDLDNLGSAVALSSNGGRLAIGAPQTFDPGYAQVFEFTPSSLPIELIYFNGEAKQEGNLLTWRTAAEIDNEGVEIQHSINGVNWEKLTFVQGQGNSSQIREYTYLHYRPQAGIHYYRLKQIDFDQSYTYSTVIAVLTTQTESEINVYPNPTSGEINIQGTESISNEVQILDQQGVILKNLNLSSQQIDLTDLPKGVYYLRAYSNQGILIKRIVKQ